MELKQFVYNEESDVIKFMFDTRRHPEVDQMLIGPAPEIMKDHQEFLKKNGHRFYILYRGGVPLGYAQFKELIPERSCEVGFVIHPKYQGKGYGNLLVGRFTAEMAKKYDHITLTVLNTNETAIKLYKKHGFSVLTQTPYRTVMQQFYGQKISNLC